MAKEAVLQVRMDAGIKERVEKLYSELGTTFSEAVRIFAVQSLNENAMPFQITKNSNSSKKRIIGIADGKYKVPEDIDKYNSEIADMFGV